MEMIVEYILFIFTIKLHVYYGSDILPKIIKWINIIENYKTVNQ